MKKTFLSVVASLVFLAAVSFAQSYPSQGSQGSSPSSQQQDPSITQGSSASGQTSGSAMGQGSETKGEKKMKGCIRSEGGQYTLEDKHGKTTPLGGQDLSAHVGHEVTVHGMWASSSSTSDSASGSSMGSSSGAKVFNVATVDMNSETCSMDKNKKSSDTMQK